MKKLLKLFFILFLLFSIIYVWKVQAWVDLDNIDWINNITTNSIGTVNKTIDDIWMSILKTIKYALWWILLIFIVYTGIQMVMSMWSDEEELKTAKRQIRYSIIWIIFINIPGSLYDAFNKESYWTNIDWNVYSWGDALTNSNLFIDLTSFWTTINDNIIWFIKVSISGVAMFMLVVAWIKIITARWREEEVTKAKHKIIWSIIWLMTVWFIESWKYFVFSWNISDWTGLFETLANLFLFFAWPIAIIYLSIAWYYYVTSNGDEEKVKKAKSIVVNTILATAIILASYTLLTDLNTL